MPVWEAALDRLYSHSRPPVTNGLRSAEIDQTSIASLQPYEMFDEPE